MAKQCVKCGNGFKLVFMSFKLMVGVILCTFLFMTGVMITVVACSTWSAFVVEAAFEPDHFLLFSNNPAVTNPE